MDLYLQVSLLLVAGALAFVFRKSPARTKLTPVICIVAFLVFAYTAATDPDTRYVSALFAVVSVVLLWNTTRPASARTGV